ncbi:MAG: T9SS type A sorting domain-containing protein [Flavobacteriales bacterium]
MTSELTYEEDGVVFIRFNHQWDTLYNFNANVGEWWFMSGPSELLQSNIKLTVVGEGVKTINGENRNYKVIEGEAQFDFGLDTIVEGIGSINGYLHQFDTYIGQMDGNDAGSFRCYSNDNFELYQYPNALPCEFIVGLNELVEKPSFSCYPNPATNILNTVIEKPVERIEIFDSSGTLILSSAFQKSLDLSHLPRGFYLVKCSTKDNFETSTIVLE